MKILVTGVGGFIGFFTAKALLKLGHDVVGIDNLNNYYDISLKRKRVDLLSHPKFEFILCDIAHKNEIENIFSKHAFEVVVNLAAQAGVRYSLSNPQAYIDSNIVGFTNILEACRHNNIKHLLYASSSSVYGMNSKMPFSVKDSVDHPVSLYAATKKANELLAHTYSHLYNLPTTGLRFFTVYGPWGRPDMAYFSFTRDIIAGKPIDVFNHGDMARDFTYIDDIVEGIIRLASIPAKPDYNWNSSSPYPGSSSAPYRVYNIGNNNPIRLGDFIQTIEDALGKEAKKVYLPMQMGDVQETFADIDDLFTAINYRPSTSLKVGIERFVSWYKSYFV
tara:strand:+ start:197 stop:1198 length:1002 start_codon:yes stop_codon:yes gene_type:complete